MSHFIKLKCYQKFCFGLDPRKLRKIPLQTIRADIDYGFDEAHTTLGRIGIKVWIYKGDVFEEKAVAVLGEGKIEEEKESYPPGSEKPGELVENMENKNVAAEES